MIVQKEKKKPKKHPWRVWNPVPKLPPGVKPQHPVPTNSRMGI